MTYRKVWEHKNDEYRQEALDRLRELFPVKSDVTTTIKNVTRSGMGRTIAVFAYDRKRKLITNVSHDVARVLNWQYDNDRGGVYVTGCGMDMAFHLTYTLARVLYRDDENWRDAGYLLNQHTI